MIANQPADRDVEAVAAVLSQHPPTETEYGPLYCRPCSEAIGDWITWTPEHAAAALLPLIREREAAAWERALRSAAVEWEALVQIEKPPIRGSVWLNKRADSANPYTGSEGE